MTFTADSAATIRDRTLQNWRARYLALGEDLDVTEGSDAYNELDALALELESLGLGAQEAANRVLLRFARGQDLDDFARDDGTARRPATSARRDITVSGPLSATTSIAGATLSSLGGAVFRPIDPTTGATLTSIDTDGTGAATILAECATAGLDGNVVVGAVLTWSSAPTGFAATATVVLASPSRARDGVEQESDALLRDRLLERRAERPASGNRADWADWVGQVSGVGRGFIYPRAMRTGVSSPFTWALDRHGRLVVLPVAPSPAEDSYAQLADGTLGQGLSPAYTRLPSEGLLANVRGYVDGTLDAAGNAIAEVDQRELYAATLSPDNILVAAPDALVVNVQVRLTTDGAAAPWPWGVTDSPERLVVSSTTTTLTLDDATGIRRDSRIAVKLGGSYIRGHWWLARVLSVAGNVVTLTAALPVAPAAGVAVRPDCGLWSAVRAEVLKLFDALGAGDSRLTSGGQPNLRSGRYPRPPRALDKLFPSKIVDRLSDIVGVEGVTVAAPLTPVVPTVGVLVVPGSVNLAPDA